MGRGLLVICLLFSSVSCFGQKKYQPGQKVDIYGSDGWQKGIIIEARLFSYLVQYEGWPYDRFSMASPKHLRPSLDEARKRKGGKKTMVVAEDSASSFIIGEWTGKSYIGERPNAKRKYADGAGPIFDSTIQELQISRVVNDTFYGEGFIYVPSDPDNNYLKTNITGWIKDSIIHIRGQFVEGKLQKYPGFWCVGDMYLNLTYDRRAYYIEGTPVAPDCATGYINLQRLRTSEITEPVASTMPVRDDSAIAIIDVRPQEEKVLQQKFSMREKSVAQTVTITGREVVLKFFDNAEVDGDSISVFANDKPIAVHRRLTAEPIVLNYSFGNDESVVVIGMLADNLGRIPPNTAVMQIIDGDKIHTVSMRSNFNQSAVVKLQRSK